MFTIVSFIYTYKKHKIQFKKIKLFQHVTETYISHETKNIKPDYTMFHVCQTKTQYCKSSKLFKMRNLIKKNLKRTYYKNKIKIKKTEHYLPFAYIYGKHKKVDFSITYR